MKDLNNYYICPETNKTRAQKSAFMYHCYQYIFFCIYITINIERIHNPYCINTAPYTLTTIHS